MLRSFCLALVALSGMVVACGGDPESTAPPHHEEPPPDVTPDGGSCGAGTTQGDDGSCRAAGIQPNGCAAGETAGEGGRCVPAGIPAEACGAGFDPDPEAGCVAVLPSSPCPAGEMAVPGETSCRPVAPCGSGTWGDIPAAATNEYVDAAYVGGGSDGSMAAPWTTLQAAVDAASEGATIAIAAGDYAEDLVVDKSVVIRGVCPSEVQLIGSAASAAVAIAAPDVELHDVAITGGASGVGVDAATGAILERVWIHDTAGHGLDVTDVGGGASVTLEGSLVEAATDVGVFAAGVEITIEASVIRDTAPGADGTNGRGVRIEAGATGEGSKATVRGSLLERNREVALYVKSSEATIAATVVRDTLLTPLGVGRGINVQDDPATGKRSTALVETSIVEGSRDVGLFVGGSDVTVEATVVRATEPAGDGTAGWGIAVQNDPTSGEVANLTVRWSLVDRSTEAGVVVIASQASLEGTKIAGTRPGSNGSGAGAIAQTDPVDNLPATLSLVGSALEDNLATGLLVTGSVATLEGVAVRDTAAGPTLNSGGGVVAQQVEGARSDVTIRWSALERNAESAIVLSGCDATIEGTSIHDSLPGLDGFNGNALYVQFDPDTLAPASAIVRTSAIEHNLDIAVLVHGSSVTFESTLVRDTLAAVGDGLFGDGIAVVGSGASVHLAGTRVEGSVRAGLSNFGAVAEVGTSVFECNAFDLDGERLDDVAFSFQDHGGNACGCEKDHADCTIETSNLAPPTVVTQGP